MKNLVDIDLKEISKDLQSWNASSRKWNPEIYSSKGNIKEVDSNLSDVINLLDGEEKELKYLKTIRFLYTHFTRNVEVYKKGFVNDDKILMNMYTGGVWVIVSYIAAACIYVQSPKAKSPDKMYGELVDQISKQVKHPTYTEYMLNAEKRAFNTESLLYEGVLAAAATVASFLMGIRLIQWNMYMIRTKLSDKLKVTAEYMEKNANRLNNTDRKNKDKIVSRQLKSVDLLNKAAEFLRIKLDDEVPVSKPPELKSKKEKDESPSTLDDLDDIEL